MFDNSISDLEAGIDQLDCILRTLQDGLSVDLHQFIYIPETGRGLGSRDRVADSVGIDARPLAFQVADEIFIQGAGREDFALCHSVLVQDLPHFDGQVGQVAAVQADAVAARIVVVDPVLPEGPDGVEDAAFEGVVGVDQENQILAHVRLDVVPERMVLALDRASVGGDETVGHRPG